MGTVNVQQITAWAGNNLIEPGIYWTRSEDELRGGVQCIRLTCGLDELGVGVVRDDGDGQVPEVQLKCTGDDVDVFIGIHRDVRLLAIWVEKRIEMSGYRQAEQKMKGTV